MTTSIEGRVVCAVGLHTFADITEAPLLMPGGIDRYGLLFDGDLTDEQVDAIWWRMTSRDAADEQARRDLYARLEGDPSPLAQALAAYTLGISIPAPTMPAPG